MKPFKEGKPSRKERSRHTDLGRRIIFVERKQFRCMSGVREMQKVFVSSSEKAGRAGRAGRAGKFARSQFGPVLFVPNGHF